MYLKQLFFSLLLILLTVSNTAFSQGASDTYTPKIIPPSPNASAIAKFGDIPVSPYTGTTDISVPIYTVSTKSISIPVGIDYHTGGIRLSEESGLVGLGWALNAGGMISRTINDKDDFTANYFNSVMGGLPLLPEIKGRLVANTHSFDAGQLGNWGYAFRCNYDVYSTEGTYSFFDAMATDIHLYDMEPDSYNFSYPGGSGKFIIARDGKVVLQKQENMKIEYATNGSSFTITDEQGNKFYFLDIEIAQPATGEAAHTSSWLLSKIITQQKDSVMFNYTSDNTWTTVKGITSETLRYGVAGYDQPSYSNVGETYLNKTLQNIDWSNGQIQFLFDNNRTDLENGKRLTDVKVFTKDAGGLHFMKQEKFYYSYFNGSTPDFEFQRLKLDSVKQVSGSTSLPPYIFNYNIPSSNQSLMGKDFSSVDHWGYFNGRSNGVNIGGPVDNTKGFTAPFIGIASIGYAGSVVGQFINIPGAYRESDITYAQAYSLNKVTYPTGGSTQFDYELNEYDFANSRSGPDGRDMEYIETVSKVVQAKINTNGTTNGTIDFSDLYLTSTFVSNASLTVAFRAANSTSLNYYHNLGYGKINFTFQNSTTDISNSNLQCSGTMTGGNCSGIVYSALPVALVIPTATTYSWSGYIDSQVDTSQFKEITATFTYQQPVYRTTTKMKAGGLRIKAITDYAANGTIAKKRTYDYGYQEDRNSDGTMESYSYGRLMGYLSYARIEPLKVPFGEPGNYGTAGSLTRYSSNFSAFTSLSSGNIVGYDQVTEYTIDPSNGNDNGKIVYTYTNSADTSFNYAGYRLPGVKNLPNNLNGFLKSKIVYKGLSKIYSKVSESNFYYRTANRIIYDCMKYEHKENSTEHSIGGVSPCEYDDHGQAIGDACICPNMLDSSSYELLGFVYPTISSEKILLDSTVEILYDQNDNNKSIVNKSYNYYDNPKHYQLTRNKTTDSKLNKHISFVRYPQDYITSGSYTGNTILDSLIGRNMVATVIEKRDSLYYNGSSTGYIGGAQLSKYRFLNANVLGLDKQYQLALASPVTDFQPFAISGSTTTSQDSRYRQMISFDTYDNDYNILQFTVPNQSASSFIYDYNDQYPVAQILKATSDQIAYTSFESDGKGNWNDYTGTITTVTAAPYPPTGNKYYNLTTGATVKLSKAVTNGKSYIISYWSKNGIYTITNGGTPVNTTGKTINGWTYYEQKVTATSTSLILSGTGAIDEVRLYPYDAQMTTYVYDAFGDVLSSCDINSRITYYEYDELQRLKLVKDQDRNVIKKICYNYAGQLSACEGLTFANVIKAQSFPKTNCSPSYYIATTYTYTVPANTYYSEISQADADQKALDDIAANGQNYANSQPGGCTVPPMINLTCTNSTLTSMTVTFKHLPTGTTYQFNLNSGVTTPTVIGQIMEGGPYDVTITPNGSHLFNFQVYSYTQMNATSFSYTNMPTICSTCATLSVSNQH